MREGVTEHPGLVLKQWEVPPIDWEMGLVGSWDSLTRATYQREGFKGSPAPPIQGHREASREEFRWVFIFWTEEYKHHGHLGPDTSLLRGGKVAALCISRC